MMHFITQNTKHESPPRISSLTTSIESLVASDKMQLSVRKVPVYIRFSPPRSPVYILNGCGDSVLVVFAVTAGQLGSVSAALQLVRRWRECAPLGLGQMVVSLEQMLTASAHSLSLASCTATVPRGKIVLLAPA